MTKKHPYETMNESANAAIDTVTARGVDLTEADMAHKLGAARALIEALETGLKIAGEFMVTGKEPYPGAALNVVKTSQRAIDLARLSNLVPQRNR